MIQVTSENNQLKIVNSGQVDYYEFSSIKNFSVLTRNSFRANIVPTKSFDILIEFTNEGKNTPLRLQLALIDNQPTWLNTLAGANIAIADLSAAKNLAGANVINTVLSPATSATAPTYTSGLLEVGKTYTITTFVAGDDFLNVGASANVTGTVFVAVGDTPTVWANGSTLTKEVIGAEITNWNAADNFTSEVISFVGRDKTIPWAFQVTDYAIIGGLPTLTLEVSLNGTDFTNYKTLSTLIDITDTVNNAYFFDDIVSFEYARFVYVSGGSTGSFSLVINK